MKLPRLLLVPTALLLVLFYPDFSIASVQRAIHRRSSKSRNAAVVSKGGQPPATATKPSGGKSAAAGKSSSAKSSTAKSSTHTAAHKSAAKKTYARKPVTQQQPDAGRVREIQQALADKGYAVEVTGTWGPQSVEALKKFQDDQNINNLTGRGKLDSLTLIALGLGPKREPPPQAPGPTEQKASTEGKLP